MTSKWYIVFILGGTIGLFTGVSLMSLFEALFWIYKVIKSLKAEIELQNMFNHIACYSSQVQFGRSLEDILALSLNISTWLKFWTFPYDVRVYVKVTRLKQKPSKAPQMIEAVWVRN